ncbi:dicarboxylate/amino acid:cation symporter [Butyrivibrio sp.]|jgi:Na+/H+-dicarboxylate symporter|uniref:dicarboxylate/amino acid:cation symporter n=1 Tax=Butyrivibrio sp. TaxID=28121 RepID=UPI0025BA36C6|nr:dicarboxylate/amino acid:cation symporter [Butyrivibrio sp.]MBE5837546.1 dicarboxylate/amino acid:cation symporter [Butyrivibrio sp.]MBE5843186.1 dicarboxylate/amino acid:cation symporter [Butyrivibrio sp.]
MKEYVFKKDRSEIPKVIDFIRECLDKKKITKKNAVRPLLAAEEILEKICEVANDDSEIIVGVESLLGNVKIKYSGKGGEFTVADIQGKLLFGGSSSIGGRAGEALQGLIQKLFGENLNVRCEKGNIFVKQQVKKSPYSNLIVTLLALVLGVATGLLMQNMLPSDVSGTITKNVFSPVYTVLINALKMIVAPLVFFSIASSIAEFSDIRALGRIAGKVVAMYILTSVLAIGVGYVTYNIFPIGNPNLAQAVDADAAAATIAKGESATISIKDTLVGIVPTDVITPFQKSDMLQIIFMAICLGLAAATLAKAVPIVKDFVSAMNMAFSKITAVIVSFMPVMVFCSMAKMMATMKFSSFMDVITWIPVVYLGDVIMICVYLVLLLIFARLNPFKFISKYYPAMVSAFTLSSSNAALPSSIRQCKSLGVSEKVYSFSLPLGATINMDGSCITLMISALFFARIYQLPVTGAMLLQLFIAIIVLSVGSPGVPGGNLVCLTLLIPQIGIPAEAISLVMGLYPIISMMQTMANVTGDAVVTTIAARSEDMVDIKKYNQ